MFSLSVQNLNFQSELEKLEIQAILIENNQVDLLEKVPSVSDFYVFLIEKALAE